MKAKLPHMPLSFSRLRPREMSWSSEPNHAQGQFSKGLELWETPLTGREFGLTLVEVGLPRFWPLGACVAQRRADYLSPRPWVGVRAPPWCGDFLEARSRVLGLTPILAHGSRARRGVRGGRSTESRITRRSTPDAQPIGGAGVEADLRLRSQCHRWREGGSGDGGARV